MIDKSKTYKTRDGREVRIYATDGHPDEPVHGAFKDYNGQWNTTIWNLNGTCRFKKCVSGEQCVDLIEVRPRHKRTVWLNMYEIDEHHVGSISWDSKELADERKISNRIACIKVDLDFEEGEGL